MKTKAQYIKKDFPVSRVRRFLEPGPIVLISSRLKDKTNIMTLGWHTVMEFNPSLIGCMISAGNYSFDLISGSKECVINIPTVDMIDQIIGIGTSSGASIDKFKEFGLTAEASVKVAAPSIKDCYANFECKVIDTTLADTYNFFIMEVVHAKVATSPEFPQTVHYRGEGIFMVSGEHISFPERLKNM